MHIQSRMRQTTPAEDQYIKQTQDKTLRGKPSSPRQMLSKNQPNERCPHTSRPQKCFGKTLRNSVQTASFTTNKVVARLPWITVPLNLTFEVRQCWCLLINHKDERHWRRGLCWLRAKPGLLGWNNVWVWSYSSLESWRPSPFACCWLTQDEQFIDQTWFQGNAI